MKFFLSGFLIKCKKKKKTNKMSGRFWTDGSKSKRKGRILQWSSFNEQINSIKTNTCHLPFLTSNSSTLTKFQFCHKSEYLLSRIKHKGYCIDLDYIKLNRINSPCLRHDKKTRNTLNSQSKF